MTAEMTIMTTGGPTTSNRKQTTT